MISLSGSEFIPRLPGTPARLHWRVSCFWGFVLPNQAQMIRALARKIRLIGDSGKSARVTWDLANAGFSGVCGVWWCRRYTRHPDYAPATSEGRAARRAEPPGLVGNDYASSALALTEITSSSSPKNRCPRKSLRVWSSVRDSRKILACRDRTPQTADPRSLQQSQRVYKRPHSQRASGPGRPPGPDCGQRRPAAALPA